MTARETTQPFEIAVGPSRTGPRFGGVPPVAIVPHLVRPTTRYLLTIPCPSAVGAAGDLTLFLSMTFEQMQEASGTIVSPGLFEVVLHEPTERDQSERFQSVFSALPIRIGEIVPDIDAGSDPPVPRAGHKIGGTPFLVGDPEIQSRIRQLTRDGFEHLFQLDVPTTDEARRRRQIAGDWPFGEGICSFFGRPPFQTADFRAVWRHH